EERRDCRKHGGGHRYRGQGRGCGRQRIGCCYHHWRWRGEECAECAPEWEIHHVESGPGDSAPGRVRALRPEDRCWQDGDQHDGRGYSPGQYPEDRGRENPRYSVRAYRPGACQAAGRTEQDRLTPVLALRVDIASGATVLDRTDLRLPGALPLVLA